MLRVNWKRLVASCHDVAMAGLAMLIALGARYGFERLPADQKLTLWVITFMAICAVCFRVLGLGRGIWRFASLTDLRTIVVASTTAVIVFVVAMFVFNRLDAFPRTIPVITWFVMLVLLGAPRLIYRAIRDGGLMRLRPRDLGVTEREHVLIAGTSSQADQMIRSYGLELSSDIKVHGIISFDSGSTGRQLRGIPIVATPESLEAEVQRLSRNGVSIDAIVVAEPEDRSSLQELLAAASRVRIPLRRVVPAQIKGSRPNLETIQLEDLLGRTPVRLELERIRSLVASRVVLVTGAGGSIGSEIVRQVASLGPSRLVILDHSEYALYLIDQELDETFPTVPRQVLLGDVRDRDWMSNLMLEEKPAIVFHAAALKHVPLVEANVREGVLTNVAGSRNVADAAVAAGVETFVMISTDKAIRPTSMMGATKRVAEAYCQALDVSGTKTRFITVRFGNVLGSAGSVVPLFKKQIQSGGPITITHPEMKRYFMTIKEATQLVLQAAVDGMANSDNRGMIFVLDMGEPVKIVDLARAMITLSGLRPDDDIAISFTGTRPGEKLFEELFDKDEETRPSGVDGVFVARAQLHPLEWIRDATLELQDAAVAGDSEKIRAVLCAIIPSQLMSSEAALPAAQ